ncbi:tyrosine-type recombinase/integrase [Bacillus bombysepticus]|uniref:tyrosine-type recombinase/integrase n=1 Tax=Bacillus bombysepticus TaxID=658666 RepID=UPI0030173006
MDEYLENYMYFLEGANRSKNTIRSYSTTINEFLSYLESKDIKDIGQIKTVHLDTYQALLRKKNVSSTIKTKMNVIGGFMNYLQSREYIEKNPKKAMIPVKVKDSDKKKKFNLDTKQALRLIEKTEENSIPMLKVRNKIMMVSFLFFGLRISELATLKVSDIALKDKTVHVLGKGEKLREIPIPPSIIEDLKAYMKTKDPDGYFFTVKKTQKPLEERSIRHLVYHHAEKAGFKFHIHPHALRRSTATMLADDGLDITSIQYLLGHNSINTTAIYINRDKEKVKEEIRQASSLAKEYKKQKSKKKAK